MARRQTEGTENEPARVCIFQGADDARKRAAIERLAAQMVEPDLRDFDYQALSGGEVTADRLITAAGVAPLGSRRRLVVVSQANAIPSEEQQAIAARIERLPESACVVLVVPVRETKDGKPKKSSELEKELVSAVRKAGQVVDFALMRDQEAGPFVADLLKQEGKTVSPSAAMAIVHRSGTDSGVLAMEVAKLVTFVGERKTITDSDVSEVTTETIEEQVFTVMDAVGSRNTARAVQSLRRLLQSGGRVEGEALRALSVFANHFRQLWQARALIDAGCRVIAPGRVPEHMESMLPRDNLLKKSTWLREKFVRQARNFTMEELVRGFERIAAADLAIKGMDASVADPTVVLELLVVDLSSRQARR